MTTTEDIINHPMHYKGKTFECIQIIEAYGLDHFRATALAYILRAPRKNGEEDLRKAVWYLRRLAGSPLNLAGASYCLIMDAKAVTTMDCDTIAEDFDIDGLLVLALDHLIPDPTEWQGTTQIREDALQAAQVIETYLAAHKLGEIPERNNG